MVKETKKFIENFCLTWHFFFSIGNCDILLLSSNFVQRSAKTAVFYKIQIVQSINIFFIQNDSVMKVLPFSYSLGTPLYKIGQNWIIFPFETLIIKNISEFTWKKHQETHKVYNLLCCKDCEFKFR